MKLGSRAGKHDLDVGVSTILESVYRTLMVDAGMFIVGKLTAKCAPGNVLTPP